jgi:hypothetical protein
VLWRVIAAITLQLNIGKSKKKKDVKVFSKVEREKQRDGYCFDPNNNRIGFTPFPKESLYT